MTRSEFIMKASAAGLDADKIRIGLQRRRTEIGAFDDDEQPAQEQPAQEQEVSQPSTVDNMSNIAAKTLPGAAVPIAAMQTADKVTGGAIGRTAAAVPGMVGSVVSRAKERFASTERPTALGGAEQNIQGEPERLLRTAGAVAGTAMDIAGLPVSVATTAANEMSGGAINNAISSLSEEVKQSPLGQKVIGWWEKLSPEEKDNYSALKDITEAALPVGAAKAAAKGAQKVEQVAGKVVGKVADARLNSLFSPTSKVIKDGYDVKNVAKYGLHEGAKSADDVVANAEKVIKGKLGELRAELKTHKGITVSPEDALKEEFIKIKTKPLEGKNSQFFTVDANGVTALQKSYDELTGILGQWVKGKGSKTSVNLETANDIKKALGTEAAKAFTKEAAQRSAYEQLAVRAYGNLYNRMLDAIPESATKLKQLNQEIHEIIPLSAAAERAALKEMGVKSGIDLDYKKVAAKVAVGGIERAGKASKLGTKLQNATGKVSAGKIATNASAAGGMFNYEYDE